MQTSKGELQASTAAARQLEKEYQQRLDKAAAIAKNFKAQSEGQKKQCKGESKYGGGVAGLIVTQ